ncbi:hypothetical protein [Acidovorax carolinensis]|uniref:hypothetical protein n=1 Tax=Acidovorax carolinensis TaxID=553814 RepID=UPI0012FF9FD5|nr:hypothetical protein [Acidovorax carolinensis]
MSVLNPGTRCIIVAGCPENIGLIVVVVERLGAHGGRVDAYRIATLSGRPCCRRPKIDSLKGIVPIQN